MLIAVSNRDARAEIFGLRLVGRLLQRRIAGGSGETEGRQDALRADDAGTGRRDSAVSVVIGEDRIFPPRAGAKSEAAESGRKFRGLARKSGIQDFRFHDLRHTFASWYMMNGGDLYELAKILGHPNIKMTERYAKLGRQAHRQEPETRRKVIWNMLISGAERKSDKSEHSLSDVRVLFARVKY